MHSRVQHERVISISRSNPSLRCHLMAELQAREAGIKAALGDESGVRPFLDDAAIFHHQDAIGFQNGGQTMRNHQRRAAFHQAIKGGLDEAFVFGIERAGCLIKEQDRRVAKNGARNRDALTLTA